MLDPLDRTTGRGLLLFAGLLVALSAFLVVQRLWNDAALWLPAAVFLTCYGMIQLDLLPRWRKTWLVLGLSAGTATFVIALLGLR
jgi:hypothetical protein